MTKIILFDEKAKDIVPGILRDYSFLDLPIWGNYKYRYFVNVIISELRAVGIDTVIIGWKDIEKLKNILKSDKIKGFFISRVSSIVWSELNGFGNVNEGPVKLSINKTPTDLYYLPTKLIYEFLNRLLEVNSVQDLFKEYFFNNFVKIINRKGYPFLMRDGYEYYNENMKIFKYLSDEKILSLLGSVQTLSQVEAYISGNVKNSYIAPGSKILGNVINSVIFEGVEIGEGSHVESSVILPGNKLEERVTIKNTLVLGGSSRVIGRETRIGDISDNVKIINHSFPLKRGLTIIGEDINIPEYSSIGSHCVIAGKGEFQDRLMINDGDYLLLDTD